MAEAAIRNPGLPFHTLAVRPSEEVEVGHLSDGHHRSRADLEAQVEAWIPAGLRLAQRLTGSAHDAEDLVQTALLKAAATLDSFRGEARVETWMYRVLVNAYRDGAAKRQRVARGSRLSEIDAAAAEPGPVAAAMTDELRVAVNRAMALLPERQREAVAMSRTGMTTTEAAMAMRTNEANVRKLLQLGRDRLRELLAGHLEAYSRGAK